MVAEKADGVFLYARCVMDDVMKSDGRGWHQVPATVQGLRKLSLPDGMGGNNGVYFRRFAGEPRRGGGRLGGEYPEQVEAAACEGESHYERYCLPVFAMLGAAAGPVPEGLLRVALDLECGAAGLRVMKQKKIHRGAADRSLKVVKGFAPASGGGGLAFFHKSFPDWLFGTEDGGKPDEVYGGETNEGHRLLAQVETLPAADKERLLTEADRMYLQRHGVFHLCEAGRLLEARERLLDFDWLLRRVGGHQLGPIGGDPHGPVADGERQVSRAAKTAPGSASRWRVRFEPTAHGYAMHTSFALYNAAVYCSARANPAAGCLHAGGSAAAAAPATTRTTPRRASR